MNDIYDLMTKMNWKFDNLFLYEHKELYKRLLRIDKDYISEKNMPSILMCNCVELFVLHNWKNDEKISEFITEYMEELNKFKMRGNGIHE